MHDAHIDTSSNRLFYRHSTQDDTQDDPTTHLDAYDDVDNPVTDEVLAELEKLTYDNPVTEQDYFFTPTHSNNINFSPVVGVLSRQYRASRLIEDIFRFIA